MYLVGHGSPEDISQSQGDVSGGTLGWAGQWDSDVSGGTRESRGHLTVPRGLWDGKDSGTVMYLVGHGSPEDIPQSQGVFGMDVSHGKRESRGHPTVPRGLWDVLTGLRNGDAQCCHVAGRDSKL